MTEADFDAIVIGSGFGGSVVTDRLAEAGMRVCLLERGRAYPPGSFPRTPLEVSRSFWDPSEGHYGMYNVWSFDKLGALVCSGLGGGSLIYANILIRKDPETFVRDEHESWPITYDDLEEHYERVERRLNAQRYPYRTRAVQPSAEGVRDEGGGGRPRRAPRDLRASPGKRRSRRSHSRIPARRLALESRSRMRHRRSTRVRIRG